MTVIDYIINKAMYKAYDAFDYVDIIDAFESAASSYLSGYFGGHMKFHFR